MSHSSKYSGGRDVLLDLFSSRVPVTCDTKTRSYQYSNCNKAHCLLVEYYPRILNMVDACHNLHNACKDICNLPEFKEVYCFCSVLGSSQC